MKKVLITGCSGYIGSHLCKELENDYDIWGLDIRPSLYPIKEGQFIQHDINHPFGEFPEEFDAVIHLAALVRVNESRTMPIQYYITNLNGTMNVMAKLKTKNFIFASTGVAEYCNDPYGTSKKAAEDVVIEYCMSRNVQDFTIFRFYNVTGTNGYGPTNPDGLISNLLTAPQKGEFTIFGDDYDTPDGTCVRDYVHVNQVCEGIKLAIEQPANEIECLGHGTGHSVKTMVDKFKEVNNVDFDVKYAPRRTGDLAETVLKDKSKYMTSQYTLEELLKV
jgi:UDP-glucose 4-epimerase